MDSTTAALIQAEVVIMILARICFGELKAENIIIRDEDRATGVTLPLGQPHIGYSIAIYPLDVINSTLSGPVT